MKNIKILVPIDFSELSLKAFAAAQELASLFDGTITPLHTMMEVWMGEGFYHPESLEIQKNYGKLQSEIKMKLDEVASRHVDAKYLRPALVKAGLSARIIMKTSADFDLIVMSSHGRSGFQRIMMGSVSEEVLRYSEVPVLIVEDKSRMMPLKKILLITDFSDSSLAAFPWALNIARETGAEIDLAHVISFGTFLFDAESRQFHEYEDIFVEENGKRIEKLIDEHFSEIKDKMNPRLITTQQSVHEALSELIRISDYNLVVMASVGHTGLNFLLLGSTTASLVRHVEVPVMVVHPD